MQDAPGHDWPQLDVQEAIPGLAHVVEVSAHVAGIPLPLMFACCKLSACGVQDFMPQIAHIFKGTATKLAPGREARTYEQKSIRDVPRSKLLPFLKCVRRFHTTSWTVT